MLLGERGFLGWLSRGIGVWRPVLPRELDRAEWIAQEVEHFNLLVGADASDLLQTKQWVLKTLDDRLSILDAKFAGILQLDAVFTAVAVFLLREVADTRQWVRITGTILFVVSIFFLFVSIWKTRPRLHTLFPHLNSASPDIGSYQRQLSGLTYDRLLLMDASHFAALWGGIFIVLFVLLVSGQRIGILGEGANRDATSQAATASPAQSPTGSAPPIRAPAMQPPSDAGTSPTRRQ